MTFLYLKATFFFVFLSEVSCLRVLNGSSLSCGIEEVNCTAEINKCFYEEWMKQQDYTPTAPVDLKVRWDIREDENGALVPVIVAQWKVMDDGSIPYLKGAELQVAKIGIGEHLCIHYTFPQKLPGMRNPKGEQWAFSVDRMVVDPGFEYFVSVASLPKPNSGYTNYNINKSIVIPECRDPTMKKTKICIVTGAFWQPNITMEHIGPTLLVSFKTVELSKLYAVFVKCGDDRQTKKIFNENNRSLLNVTFDLEAWPRTCCNFNVWIQPFFDMCRNDCVRKNNGFYICPKPDVPPKQSMIWIIFAGIFLLFCGLLVFAAWMHCKKRDPKPKPRNESTFQGILPPERSVLILYSRDHPKYTDIVLKLSAFLRAKCGIEVYLDLLDTTTIGVMGRLPWTEQQKRHIEQSSNKVLVLCSPGVQAKWGAMCGGPRIYLREDVRSPMGDMLTLALQLFTVDIQCPASYGKYLVAYFEDICGLHDVPSMFDLAVKYKLMKHFEELYFRILDVEKYQQGKIHTIDGLGIDEYFNCPSGKALRDAIEVFQTYQLENPDWFEKECLDGEDEEPAVESSPFLDQSIQPIFTCEPVLNIGPPVFEHGVQIHQKDQVESIWISEIPHLNIDFSEKSVVGIQPVQDHVYSLYPSVEPPPGIQTSGIYPSVLDSHSCLLAKPALQMPLQLNSNEVFTIGGLPGDDGPVEDDADAIQQLMQLQVSLASFQVPAPPPSVDDFHQPEEMEENEMEEPSGKRQSRWSDQGYSSRDSIVREEPQPSSLTATAKLQQVLYLNSPISSGFCTETMES
ncbi:interleukin 17 receptor A1a [Hoplias malabaricus]|uniref:interleukin 17 receptor A1a n=1 Tax=Hoplias malabaricus TaxID=27720 RepID=UPI003463048E